MFCFEHHHHRRSVPLISFSSLCFQLVSFISLTLFLFLTLFTLPCILTWIIFAAHNTSTPPYIDHHHYYLSYSHPFSISNFSWFNLSDSFWNILVSQLPVFIFHLPSVVGGYHHLHLWQPYIHSSPSHHHHHITIIIIIMGGYSLHISIARITVWRFIHHSSFILSFLVPSLLILIMSFLSIPHISVLLDCCCSNRSSSTVIFGFHYRIEYLLHCSYCTKYHTSNNPIHLYSYCIHPCISHIVQLFDSLDRYVHLVFPLLYSYGTTLHYRLLCSASWVPLIPTRFLWNNFYGTLSLSLSLSLSVCAGYQGPYPSSREE